MHEAYQIHPVLSLPHQVESLAAYGNTLLVGTKQGHLFIYSLEKVDPKCQLTMKRNHKNFSKYPIKQLEVIPEHELFLCLTDNTVHLHDIHSLRMETLHTVEKSKGATLFAVNTEKIISITGDTHILVKLAVAVKRKIQLYFMKNNSFLPLYDNDICLPDVPKSMVWSQNVICLGYRDEYCLHVVTENKKIDLFPTSSAKSADPCILLISPTHFALCREDQTVLVDTKGNAEEKQVLKWSEPPAYLAYDAPYTLGVISDAVEVCSLEPSMSVQTLTDLPKVRFLVQGKSGLLFAASLSQVWCLKGVDILKQTEYLVNGGEFQLAIKLIEISEGSDEEKQKKTRDIQTRLALDLFAKKQFAESMKVFLELKTDPYDVIKLYPDMLPQAQQDDFVPNNKDLTDKETQESIEALSDYLTVMRPHVLEAKPKPNSGNKNTNAQGKLIQIIDTILVKCYLQTKHGMVALILKQNHCHLEETERVLKKMHKFNDLIILYKTKGKHRKALELLKTEKSIEEESVDKTIEYLQKLGSDNMGLILEFSEWVLEKEPEKGLKIFIEDLAEVENLRRPPILDHLLKGHPDLAIPYLEHVIKVWKDENPIFHNVLIHQYREKILKDGVAHSRETREKLQSFLKKSTQYHPENVLKDFPSNSLLEERAVILGKLKRHDQAIALYVRALGDVEKAKDYCSQVYEKGGPGSQNVYVSLINLILRPESFPLSLPGVVLSHKTSQPDIELALKLLEENASRINPVDMLATLPDEVSVSRIYKFLSTAVQKVLQERRSVQLLKGLLYAEHLQCQDMKLALQSQHVLITELSICPVCKKRFSNQAALIRYPNGDVVHYACHKDK